MNLRELPIIIPATFGTAETQQLALPTADQNLFRRIIRNPQAADRRPRERACTEMLCAVMLNTEQLRNTILDWLGGKVGQSLDWDNHNLSFATEQSILGKRDDLRIQGYHADQDNPTLLWSIEVKVGSSFHHSSAIDPESESGSLNQITVYDRWLSQHRVDNRAGFVLSVRDMTAGKPDGLRFSWPCLTWTELGTVIERLLAGNTLSATEAFLSRHFLGFIHDFLWEATMATPDVNYRLDFDDLALIRAFDLIGKRTTERVDLLIASLVQVMASADLGGGAPLIWGKILQGHNRKVVGHSLLDPANKKPPYLFAGLTTEQGLHVTVWLETSPKHAEKQALHQMLGRRLPLLLQRNSAWRVIPFEAMSYWDLELAVPAEHLLVADDQVTWIEEFVAKALDDLKATGVIEELRQIASGPDMGSSS